MKESIAYIGIGSNMGDRLGYIQQSVTMLSSFDGIDVLETSGFYETEPYGFKEQNWFVNAIIKIKTTLLPIDLLHACQSVEEKLGRVRGKKWGPRTIDLDILFYDNLVVSSDILTIPHPGMKDRAYCIVPMLELDENFVHPVLKKTMLQIHSDLESVDEVFLYGTRPVNLN